MNNKVFGVGEFKYAIQNFKGGNSCSCSLYVVVRPSVCRL